VGFGASLLYNFCLLTNETFYYNFSHIFATRPEFFPYHHYSVMMKLGMSEFCDSVHEEFCAEFTNLRRIGHCAQT